MSDGCQNYDRGQMTAAKFLRLVKKDTKTVVHKNTTGFYLTICGIYLSIRWVIITNEWSKVTCKNCLRLRPRAKK